MGLRRNILVAIKNQINGLVVDSQTITAVNTFFDPDDDISKLPKFAVVPNPENKRVGLLGHTTDCTFPIGIYGYAVTAGETLFLDSEDVIETIVRALTSEANAAANVAAGFSVVSFDGIVAEQRDLDDPLCYIAIPITVEFLED